MSIEALTDTTVQVTRPRSAESTNSTEAVQRARADDSAAAQKVSLSANRELDDLVKVVAKAPTEISKSDLQDIARQIRNGDYVPKKDGTAERILGELGVLPDPPYDSLPVVKESTLADL